MKKLLVLLLFVPAFSRAQSVSQIEDSASYYLSNIRKYSMYFSPWKEGQDDSLYLYNERLQKYLADYLAKEPLTLKYNFVKLQDSGMKIATSDDKKLRIYSWDEESGGTMHGFYSLLQYQSQNGTHAKVLYPKLGKGNTIAENEGPGFFYPRIYEVQTKDKKAIYLAIREGMYSTKDVSTGVVAYAIENDCLNDSIKVFKTANRLLNNIDCDYDYFSNYNEETMKENWLIHLSEDGQKLFIPIVYSEKMTGKYLIYVFDGNNYVFDKNLK